MGPVCMVIAPLNYLSRWDKNCYMVDRLKMLHGRQVKNVKW